MIALLFLAGIFSVIDRGALNVLVDPVRHDLGINDEQIGLLQGLAFGLFYAFMGMPMGMLADRVSRRNLVIGGIGLWSIATMASGLAETFGHLFAARLMVGLGEAALGPAAISLIADLFAPERRGRPISIYMMGQGLANGISISLTGLLLAGAADGVFADVPVLAALAPWRVPFVIFGALGLLIAAMMLLTREPARHMPNMSLRRVPGAEEAAYLWRNRGVLLPLYFAFAICFAVAYGAGSWWPTMLMRGYGATPSFLGEYLGPISMAFSAIGPLIGGTLLDRSMRQGRTHARFTILALAPVFILPSVLAVLTRDLTAATVLVASANAIFAVMGTVMFATLQSVVPAHMRGSSISLTLVLNTIIGATMGPLLVATVTQRVIGDPAQVGWSIVIVCLPCLIIGTGLYLMAGRAIHRGDGDCARLLAAEAPAL